VVIRRAVRASVSAVFPSWGAVVDCYVWPFWMSGRGHTLIFAMSLTEIFAMAHVAVCPLCDFEFLPGTSADSESIACPSCGASFALTGNSSSADDTGRADASPVVSSSIDELDAAQRRIDKWFQSNKTVPDVGAEIARGEVSSRAAEIEPAEVDFKPEPLDENARQTIDLASDADEHDGVTLELSSEADNERPTWDDSERMERLLADIEVQPIDDFLPVSRESHAPMLHDDDDRTETVEYSPADYDRLGIHSEPLNDSATADEAANESTTDEFAISPIHRPRRKKSALRSLVGLAVAGVFGLACGYLILLWLMGPDGDFLQIARHLPNSILPASLRESSQPAARNSSLLDSTVAEIRMPGNVAAATDAEPLPLPPINVVTPSTSAAPTTLAERQASFDTSATASNPTAPSVIGNRYPSAPTDQTPANFQAIEPARLDEPASTPRSMTETTAPKISEAPTYSADQLAAALIAAREAQPGLLAGNLNDTTVQRSKGLSYSKLCDLAEIATFAGVGSSVLTTDNEQTAAVEALFKESLVEERVRGEVARIVPIWISSIHRRHGGIFFAGTIVGRVERGTLTECQLDLGTGSTISVLAPTSIVDRLAANRAVAVVGSLIDKPAERIDGYSGSAPQVVWAKSLISLDR